MAVDMSNPATWPLGVVLPLVKRGGGIFPDLGLLLPNKGPVVYLCEMHAAGARELEYCEKLAYPSFEALAEEWMVD